MECPLLEVGRAWIGQPRNAGEVIFRRAAIFIGEANPVVVPPAGDDAMHDERRKEADLGLGIQLGLFGQADLEPILPGSHDAADVNAMTGPIQYLSEDGREVAGLGHSIPRKVTETKLQF